MGKMPTRKNPIYQNSVTKSVMEEQNDNIQWYQFVQQTPYCKRHYENPRYYS